MIRSIVCFLILACSATCFASARFGGDSNAPFSMKTGLRFIPNRGQLADTDNKPRPDILYYITAGPMRVYFHRTGVSYVFVKRSLSSLSHSETRRSLGEESFTTTGHYGTRRSLGEESQTSMPEILHPDFRSAQIGIQNDNAALDSLYRRDVNFIGSNLSNDKDGDQNIFLL